MTFKLSEIFVALPEQSTYSALSFYQMEVRADFIDRLAIHFHLLYLDKPLLDEQLCYASSENVRLEYKYFITKAELLKMVLPQIGDKDIALENRSYPISKSLGVYWKSKNIVVEQLNWLK